MGAAYSISHKEGHGNIYKPWINNTVGNFFENWIGVFYGNVPRNFTTTHISIHHRLDAGRGDTLYNWDIPRSCIPSFMLYLVRGVFHCTGFGGLVQFYSSPRKRDRNINFKKLGKGCAIFWLATPVVVGYFFDLSFYFWIIVQPLLCMTFFLSIINHGFHGFIELDENGVHIGNVTSTTMVGGLDDYFGEDDHMAHHHYVGVYYRNLPEHQRKQIDVWAEEKASVFQGFDVFTFAVWVLLKGWPVMAKRYLDFSGKMSQQEIETMLELRAKRRDTEYSGVLPAIPWGEKVQTCIDEDVEKALISVLFPSFDCHSRKLQLWICEKMGEGLPPIKSLLDLGFASQESE
jgi:fatty acid desaturase